MAMHCSMDVSGVSIVAFIAVARGTDQLELMRLCPACFVELLIAEPSHSVTKTLNECPEHRYGHAL